MILGYAEVTGTVVASGDQTPVVSGFVKMPVISGSGAADDSLYLTDIDDASLALLQSGYTGDLTAAVVDSTGRLFATVSTGGGGYPLLRLDPRTGRVIEQVGICQLADTTQYRVTSMALDHATGVVYCSALDDATALVVGIHTIDLDTAVLTPVVAQAGTSGDAIAFHPDGTCYQSQENSPGPPRLITVNLGTGAETVVASTTAWLRHFVWHPDLRGFVGVDGSDGPTIWLVGADGTEQSLGTPSQSLESITMLAHLSRAVISGTVDTQLTDDFVTGIDGHIVYGERVLLNGEDVSSSLRGQTVIRDSIDLPFTRATFELEGSRFSPFATENTWNRTGRVQIFWTTGAPGRPTERREFIGSIDTCKSAGNKRWVIECVDDSYLYAKAEVCLEIPPFSGLTMGEMAGQMAQAAGMPPTEYDFPDGPVFNKPYQAGAKTLFELLRDFGAPQSWAFRRRMEDNVLEAYVPEISREPDPPDHIWDVQEFLDHVEITPPTDVPSRWIVRGDTVVEQDEAGQEVEVTKIKVEGDFAPTAAPFKQEDDGSLIASGFTQKPASFRLISEIEDRVTRRGGVVLRQETIQRGWYNEAAAKWQTSGSGGLGNGPAPGGYYFTNAFVTADGEFVLRGEQRYRETGRRIQDFELDANNTVVGIRVEERGFLRREQGVRKASPTLDDRPTVQGALIGSDDISYSREQGSNGIERYGSKTVNFVSYEYHATTGAQTKETTESYGYTRIRCRVDEGGGNYYVNADGVGQSEITANWRLFARSTKQTLLDSSGRLLGEIDTEEGYNVVELNNAPGAYDWGEFMSYRQIEAFTIIEQTSKSIRVDSPDSYLEVTYDADGKRDEQRILGKPPIPSYTSSPWIQLVSVPLEAMFEDSTIEAWFGSRTIVLDSDFIQTNADALRLMKAKIDRHLSHEIKVTRLENFARPGETVLVTDRDQGVAVRFIITDRERTRQTAVPSAFSTYVLQHPLRRVA